MNTYIAEMELAYQVVQVFENGQNYFDESTAENIIHAKLCNSALKNRKCMNSWVEKTTSDLILSDQEKFSCMSADQILLLSKKATARAIDALEWKGWQIVAL